MEELWYSLVPFNTVSNITVSNITVSNITVQSLFYERDTPVRVHLQKVKITFVRCLFSVN